MLEQLAKNMEKGNIDLKILLSDIARIKKTIGTEEKASRQSLEKMTRLRKNKEEVEEAQENPDMQFIQDKLNDIIKEIFG